jgi:hypothetical protein
MKHRGGEDGENVGLGGAKLARTAANEKKALAKRRKFAKRLALAA